MLHSCWWGPPCSSPRPLDVLAYVLLAAGPVALVLRCRHPRGVFLFVFGVTLLYVALGYPQGPIYVSLVIAFVRVVIAGHRWLTRGSIIACWALFLWLPPAVGAGPAPQPLAAVSLAAWLLVLVVGCEAMRGRRERATEASRRREEEARRRADEERLRIARELHDVLAHSISLINVQSGVALHLLDERPEQARSALEAINEASAQALREVRSVLGILRGADEHAPRAPTAGLARLDELVTHTAAAGVEVSVELEGNQRPLPTSLDLAAYRIVQESLTNVVRHSGARRASVRIGYGERALTLLISDDGERRTRDGGPDPGDGVAASGMAGVAGDRAAGVGGDGAGGIRTAGSGIAGMRERAAALGGELEASPSPGGGFSVRARLPLETAALASGG